MKKALITGGAGFIGTHLAHRLQQEGWHVILCDFEHRFTNELRKNFETVGCDISKKTHVEVLPQCDVIYHLAGQVGTLGSLKDPKKDLEWNALGTFNISTFSKVLGAKTIVYASTMAIYGNSDAAREEEVPRPLSPYGITKLCGEHYVNYAAINSNLRAITLRLFNVYGPGQSTKNLTQGLASIFLKQVHAKNTVEVMGDLGRYRDLIYIDDVIEAFMLPLYNSEMNGVYNVCSGKPYSIKSVIEEIIKISEKNRDSIQVNNIGGHPGDPYGVWGDNSKLKKLGWEPKIELKEGLQKCWNTIRLRD